MAGLLQPAGGHVRIGGRTLFDRSAGIDLAAPERRIGYLFQSYALFPHLSVRDNVGFGLTNWRRGLRAAKAAGSTSCCTASGSPRWPKAARRRCRAASSNGSRWRGRWPASRMRCCWTSPSRR